MSGKAEAVQPAEIAPAAANGQSAQRASSLHAAPALPLDDARVAVTGSDETPGWRQAADRVPAALSAITTGASLLHARPPSLAEQAGRHAAAAAHFEAGMLRWPRQAWGWLHLLIKASLHTAEWLTESFPRAVVAFAVWTAVHLWLWPALPWF